MTLPSPWQTFPTVVHGMSDASTASAITDAVKAMLDHLASPDYSSLYLSVFPRQVPQDFTWLLDPDEGYPGLEYGDLDESQRALCLTCRASWWIEREKVVIDKTELGTLERDIRRIAERITDDHVEATRSLARDIVEAAERSNQKAEALRRQGPQPAHPSHLMAEGSVLARVRHIVADGGGGYQRKVVFPEPVNAFTMLYGDRIARPGDMHTAVTMCDTEEVTQADAYGNNTTRYWSKAVTL